MAQQLIDVGISANDGQGMPIRTAFIVCNNNFTQLFDRVKTTPPGSPEGASGDAAGMIAWDNTYLYICVDDYTDGSTAIWQRVLFDTNPW